MQQLLLALGRDVVDRPALDEPLEEELDRALPGVVGAVRWSCSVDGVLAARQRRHRAAQREDVAPPRCGSRSIGAEIRPTARFRFPISAFTLSSAPCPNRPAGASSAAASACCPASGGCACRCRGRACRTATPGRSPPATAIVLVDMRDARARLARPPRARAGAGQPQARARAPARLHARALRPLRPGRRRRRRSGCELWMHPDHAHMRAALDDPDAALARRLEVARQSGVPVEPLEAWSASARGRGNGIARLVEPDRELRRGRDDRHRPRALDASTRRRATRRRTSACTSPSAALLVSGDHLLGRVSLYFDYGWTPGPGRRVPRVAGRRRGPRRAAVPRRPRAHVHRRAGAHRRQPRARRRAPGARARGASPRTARLTAYDVVPLLYGEPLSRAQRGLVAARDALLPAPPRGRRRGRRARRRRPRALDGRVPRRLPSSCPTSPSAPADASGRPAARSPRARSSAPSRCGARRSRRPARSASSSVETPVGQPPVEQAADELLAAGAAAAGRAVQRGQHGELRALDRRALARRARVGERPSARSRRRPAGRRRRRAARRRRRRRHRDRQRRAGGQRAAVRRPARPRGRATRRQRARRRRPARPARASSAAARNERLKASRRRAVELVVELARAAASSAGRDAAGTSTPANARPRSGSSWSAAPSISRRAPGRGRA